VHGVTDDLSFMHIALREAEKCETSPTAFSVGCVLVVHKVVTGKPIVLATGYSRELPGNTHAEANAVVKARALSADDLARMFPSSPSGSADELLHHAEVYTTMEPCSVRTSGLSPCADALIAAKVRRCIIGVGEPADFVVCDGARKLAEAGIEVVWLKGLEDECLSAARRGHPQR
jgi:pyrimidine deaminase RibD-like protein